MDGTAKANIKRDGNKQLQRAGRHINTTPASHDKPAAH
jgi:hypothetical protein